jgi:hypothetical protein
MPASEFNSPATLQVKADGTVSVTVTGPLTIDPAARGGEVDFRFLIVQGNVIVKGAGHGTDGGWRGTATADPGSLQAAAAQAIGLAILVKEEPPGFETFTWSEQIELERA